MAGGHGLSAPHRLIVVGGGEHARVVLEAARSCPAAWEVAGYVEPSDRARTGLDACWLGTDEDLLARRDWQDALFVLGVGWSVSRSARAEIARRYEEQGVAWATVVHAWARVSARASLGAGVVVGAGAIINGGATIGPHSVVNTGAVVEHDVFLGSHVHAAPGAVIGGGAEIGDRAFLGLGCRVRDHVQIGREATVAMGATVVGSVDAGQTVMGTPARPVTRSGADA